MTPLVPPCHPLTVLVVDDWRDAADSLGDLLSLLRVQTRTAYGGEDALRLFGGWGEGASTRMRR